MKSKVFSLSILFSLMLGMSNLFAGCNYLNGLHGNGNVVKETRPVSSFDALDVSGAFDVYIKQGDAEGLVIETDDNLLPSIKTTVVGHTLKIETKNPIHHVTVLKAYITVKDLKKIDVSGAVDIQTENRLTVPELSIDASGASDSKMEIAVQRLKLDCSGASKMSFSGTAVNVEMDLSGSSDIFAYDLISETYSFEISGAGDAQINVSKSIKASISGAGSVKYKGSPSEIDQVVSGAGSIKKVQ
ncbi:MAG: DUF2807 domain-containing protein [Bacteroidales bacterium]|nr:DUF2807 domain-containing protein [Bacteroidales bacterium]MDD4603836.1 DUF2807 domain-containing protein [Bacteroidales bacterium]